MEDSWNTGLDSWQCFGARANSGTDSGTDYRLCSGAGADIGLCSGAGAESWAGVSSGAARRGGVMVTDRLCWRALLFQCEVICVPKH